MKTIKDLCKQWNMTQKECAEHFGIPLRTLQEWSQGRRTPPVYVIRMMEQIKQMEENMGQIRKIEDNREYRHQIEHSKNPEVNVSVECIEKYITADERKGTEFERKKGESDFNGLLDFLDEIH